MASLNTTKTSRHDQFVELIKPHLEKHFTMLPSMTYHDILGNSSKEANLIRRASGSLALDIRCQCDINLVNSKNQLIGVDCKVSSSIDYNFEAHPVIHHMLNDHAVFYIHKNPETKEVKIIPIKELMECTPKKLVIVTDNGYPYEQLIRRAKAIWTNLKIEKKTKADIKAGSGDHYLVFHGTNDFYSSKEGLELMVNYDGE